MTDQFARLIYYIKFHIIADAAISRRAQGGQGVDPQGTDGVDRGNGETETSKIPAAKDPTRNVWLQLGLADAGEHYLKAELVFRLDKTIEALGLTQRAAARRLRTTQPELSKILRGKFSEISLERLMRFLTALGHRIEIKIGAAREDKAGEVVVGDIRRRAA